MPTYRYFRLLCHSPHAAGGYFRVGEIEMRAAAEGENLCSSGTAFGNGDYYPASRAFDGGYVANSSDWAGVPGDGRTIGYDFGAETLINIIRVQNSNSSNSSEQDQHLLSFEIQGSNDQSEWATLLGVTDHPRGASAYVDYSVQTFTLSGLVTDDAGSAASRTVRAYRRDTGALIDSAVSSPVDGAFVIQSPYAGAHYVIALDDDAGDQYNALIFDRVTPV